jgi:tetratricopeptide (TPR) repeat protein
MKKMERTIIGFNGFFVFALIGLCWTANTSLVSAQTLSSSNLQDPFNSAGASARAFSMGSAFVGVADDSSAIYFNPAGLATLKSNDLSLHHLIGLAGISQDILDLSLPLGNGFGLGLTGQFVDYGSFQGRNADGTLTTTTTSMQFAGGVAGGLQLFKGFSIGTGLRATIQQLATNSYDLFNADFGILYEVPQGWRFGASYDNLGTAQVGYSASSLLRVGASKYFSGKGQMALLVATGYTYEPNVGSQALIGIEASLQSMYFLRVGYQGNLQDTGLNGLQGLTLGAGIQYSGISLDYAFEAYGDLGSTNRLSLDYRFGGNSAPEQKEINKNVGTPIQQVKPTQVQPQPVVGTNGAAVSQSLTVQFDLASPNLDKGMELEKAGDWKGALDAYRLAITDNPKNAKAWWRMGTVYYQHSFKDYAVYCFEEVVKLKPEDTAMVEWLQKYKGQTPSVTP